MELFDNNGCYNYMSFTGKSGTWNLISTETNFSNVQVPLNSHISDEILKCLDTFKLYDGSFKTVERFKVMEQFKNGKIKPVKESLIPTMKTYSKKEWDKKTNGVDR